MKTLKLNFFYFATLYDASIDCRFKPDEYKNLFNKSTHFYKISLQGFSNKFFCGKYFLHSFYFCCKREKFHSRMGA